MENDIFEEKESLSNAELINNDSFERLRAKIRRRTFDEWLFIVLVLLVLCTLLLGLIGLLFFRAKHVQVRGGTYYDNAEILKNCGITDKDNLFFINAKDLEDELTLLFPYIGKVTVERKLPTTVILHITEDKPSYYTVIGDEVFLLSESLRVLDHGKDVASVTKGIEGLYEVTLPTVTYAVVGRSIEFERDSTRQYLIDFFKVINASEYVSHIDAIDIASKFAINLYLYDGQYKVMLGTAEEAEEKLLFFTNIIQQKLDPDTIAVIDVSDIDRAFVSVKTEKIEN